MCDRIVSESWTNRRENARLVAEVVGDRQGKSIAAKSMVTFHQSFFAAPPVVDGRGSVVARLMVRSVVGCHD